MIDRDKETRYDPCLNIVIIIVVSSPFYRALSKLPDRGCREMNEREKKKERKRGSGEAGMVRYVSYVSNVWIVRL